VNKKIVIYTIIVLAIIILLFSIINLFVENEICSKIASFLSIFGTCASLLGIGLTYKQILSVKETSDEIKSSVDKSLNEINEFLSFSDISSTIKQIHEIQTFIHNSKIELALIRIRDLRFQLIQIKHNKKLQEFFNYDEISGLIIDIGIDIKNINTSILDEKKSLNFITINKHLDNTITCLEEISSQLKNNKL